MFFILQNAIPPTVAKNKSIPLNIQELKTKVQEKAVPINNITSNKYLNRLGSAPLSRKIRKYFPNTVL